LGVIIEATPFDKGGQFGAQFPDRNANDKIRKVVRVRPDIADASTCPRLRRIGPPLGLLLSGRFDRLGKPILRVLDLYDPDVAEFTGLHHLSGLTHHRIAGVIVRYRENTP